MPSISVHRSGACLRLLAVAAAAAALALASPAAAAAAGKASAAAKHRVKHGAKLATRPAVRAGAAGPAARACRGAALFPCGPLEFAGTYLGDDPDPNIRFQIWRDLGARFGGED